MLTRWYDINRDVAFDDATSLMNRLFEQAWSGRGFRSAYGAGAGGAFPRANLYDTGSAYTAVFHVPGLNEDQLSVEVHGDVLTVGGERRADAPEGYKVHRAERGARTFTRSFGLPGRVDPEKTTAKLENGVLTVTMEKHPEAQPKQISVKAS